MFSQNKYIPVDNTKETSSEIRSVSVTILEQKLDSFKEY